MRGALDGDLVLGRVVLVVHANLVFAGQALVLADDGLDVGREDVDGADDEHLVLAAEDVDTARSATAAARRLVDPADVAGAEADHGTRVLEQRGVDDFALLAVGQHLAGHGVNGLDENLVLDQVQAVFLLAHACAGAVYVGQAEEVVDLCAPDLLDGMARGLDGAAGLTGDDDRAQVGEILLGVIALLDCLLAEQPGVRGRRPHVGRLVVLHGPQQARGRHGADPDAQRAEVLGADDAGAADVQREVHAVQVAVVWTHADLPEQTGLGIHEVVEVLLVERAHRGNAGRAGGGGHVDDVVFGNRAQLAEEGADALAVALGLLVDEGELLKVGERLAMGLETRLIPGALVVRAVLVGEGELFVQALELQRLDVLARSALDFGIVVLLIVGDVLLGHYLAPNRLFPTAV